ncbi:hypothetical protein BI364_06740 [Acidihalobacter yilgarnensis]|uniref:Pentapeptide repeat-containing protein n=1 Tax=Acidihalobacter yilgarnensis TaxID=2819280 RepID=A0A1D8IMP2_9GAMM|nr:pentapeptide repeat-containing protein [Acidihalobacter yilgarnensis]AOU97695.1 hypothetical protein BI364_06740 [Acidihalobacter yilgarnensis]
MTPNTETDTEQVDPCDLLSQHKIEEFNAYRAAGKPCRVAGKDLHAMDLRKVDVSGVDFSGCLLDRANLCGLDLRSCTLDGATLRDALIERTYFPASLDAAEIELSLKYGTRLRARP